MMGMLKQWQNPRNPQSRKTGGQRHLPLPLNAGNLKGMPSHRLIGRVRCGSIAATEASGYVRKERSTWMVGGLN
jgi:hypothetical protein